MASIIAFYQAHSVMVAALVVAILDFAIDVSPALASNSLISLALSFFKKPAA
jgi:hypothetical protein